MELYVNVAELKRNAHKRILPFDFVLRSIFT